MKRFFPRLARWVLTVAGSGTLRLMLRVGLAGSAAFVQSSASVTVAPWQLDLELQLQPATGTLSAQVRLQAPVPQHVFEFSLYPGFHLKLMEPHHGRLERVAEDRDHTLYRVTTERLQEALTLEYQGVMDTALRDVQEGLGREHQVSRGAITAEGVFLGPQSGWYPDIAGARYRFKLGVRLPAGWLAVTQGQGPVQSSDAAGARIVWQGGDQTYEGLDLVAGPWTLYREQRAGRQVQVYLRRPEPELAQRYLDTSFDDLERFQQLLGPYPHDHFAVVENFWETGYGMPSFTLLGSRVIRLPFILRSSLPHEIMHNWWGNGVTVDLSEGNWSEGLTTYLADHAIQEREGQGANARREALQRYWDHAQTGDDFPLREFTGRHTQVTQAVGYDKGMMFWHMLRKQVGDAPFIASLRELYRQYLDREAGFSAIRRVFESVTGQDLQRFFTQWTERRGGPELHVGTPHLEAVPGGYQLTLDIRQSEPYYDLALPYRLHCASDSVTGVVPVSGTQARLQLHSRCAPVRLDLDPQFDLFRVLALGETPLRLANLFAAKQGILLLAADLSPAERAAYEALAQSWLKGQPGWRLEVDRPGFSWPTDRPLGFLGASHARGASWLDELQQQGLLLQQPDGLLRLGNGATLAAETPLALVASGPHGQVIGWIRAREPAAIAALGRKLPHYGKFSLITLDAGLQVESKLVWPLTDSPFQLWLTEERPLLGDSASPALY